MDYMPESTAITLFNYPKDSARRNCFQWRTLLPSPPSKPNPSSTYEICVLCRPRSLLNSHLPFPWLRHRYPPLPLEAPFLLSPSPAHSPRIIKYKQEGKLLCKTISSFQVSWMWCNISLEKKSSLPTDY